MGKLDPRRMRRKASADAEPPHYVVEHSGWASVGWSEGDPTADEAIAALASLNKVNVTSAMAGLRKSGESSLSRLQKG